MKPRVTTHFARVNKGGQTFTAKHNDRNFDPDNAPHIDPEKSKDNAYAIWKDIVYSDGRENQDNTSFEDAEKEFYDLHFSAHLEKQNERNIKAGHRNRCMDMDQYRQSKRYCPTECEFMIGDKEYNVDSQLLTDAFCDFLLWRKKRYPQVWMLDRATHVDEEGAPHVHERMCFVAHDGDGNETACVEKCLEEMGVPLPNPEKPVGRYNNRMMTFTADCRAKFIEVCRQEYGIDVEVAPRDPGQSGLTLLQYKARQEQAKLDMASAELADMQKAREEALRDKQAAQAETDEIIRQADEILEEKKRREKENESLKQQTEDLRQETEEAGQQALEALRKRDQIRTEGDVLEVLKQSCGSVLNGQAIHVDILDEKDAKRSLVGKETPATVTIPRDQFNALKAQAMANDRVVRSAKEIGTAVQTIQIAAADANTNQIDRQAAANAAATSNEGKRAKALKEMLDDRDRELSEKDKQLAELSNKLQTYETVYMIAERLPEADWDAIAQRTLRALDMEWAYRNDRHISPTKGGEYVHFEDRDYSIKPFLQMYMEECKNQRLVPLDDMKKRLESVTRRNVTPVNVKKYRKDRDR